MPNARKVTNHCKIEVFERDYRVGEIVRVVPPEGKGPVEEAEVTAIFPKSLRVKQHASISELYRTYPKFQNPALKFTEFKVPREHIFVNRGTNC